MAIQWSRATISDPNGNAGINGDNFRAEWRTRVLAHPAWSEVDVYVTGTFTWRVFMCDAAVSGLAKSFYIVMGFTSGNLPATTFGACEDYDVATHTMSKFAPSVSGGSRTLLDADTTLSQTYVLAQSLELTGATQPRLRAVTITASADFWMYVSEKMLLWGFGATVAASYAAGSIYDTFLGADDPFCVSFGSDYLNTGATTELVTTRHPLITTPTTVANQTYSHTMLPPAGLTSGSLSSVSQHYVWPVWARDYTFLAWDKYMSSGPMMAELGAVNAGVVNVGATAAGPAQGILRGKLRDVRYLPAPSGLAHGDTVVSDGTVWYYSAASVWINTGVAAP